MNGTASATAAQGAPAAAREPREALAIALVQTRRQRLLIVGLLLALALLFVASLTVGRTPLDVGAALAQWLRGDATLAALVLTELRLPRALLAVLVGASLGLAGAALQGLLRNPLAEPGIIGVSACASLGAVIVFYSGLAVALPLALPLGGMLGALLAVLLLHLLAGREAGTLTLILAGVAINGFAGAATALALNLAPNPFAVTEIVFWMMGSLADRSMLHVQLALPLIVAGWALLAFTGRSLDALSLGEDTATSLGVRLPRLRMQLVVGTALAVGASVAMVGAVGFVGLVVPHLLRPLVGHQPSRLLAASALGGAVLVLAADVALRLVPAGPELKLGVVTALVGAPFFLMLVMKLRREAI